MLSDAGRAEENMRMRCVFEMLLYFCFQISKEGGVNIKKQ